MQFKLRGKLKGKKVIMTLAAVMFAVGVLVPTATAAAATNTTAALSATLNGAGATFPQPLYSSWIGAFQAINKGVKINYQGVGSGAGITQFTAQTVDFGASDAYMKPSEIAAAQAKRPGASVVQIPTVFGAITLSYNLPGVTGLKLDSNTLVKIYLGTVKMWNDPAIKALNAGKALPAIAIKTVHRSDSSGTTNAFTTYLSNVNATWNTKVGFGKSVTWPVGVGGSGNAGVAAYVKQNKGAIGYVELQYAYAAKLTTAQMKNKAGKFIAPSLTSTTAAATGISIPSNFDLLSRVSNSSNAAAYPIVTPTYLLSYSKWPDASKVAAFKAWVNWSLGTSGTALAKKYGYAPLPTALKTLVLNRVALIH